MKFSLSFAIAGLFAGLSHAQVAGNKLPLCDISYAHSEPVRIISDTQGVDFGAYSRKLVRSIKQNWFNLMPPVALPPQLKEGCVVVAFRVGSDGSLQEDHLALTSGDVSLDRAAWGAIKSAFPFPPLPADFKGDSVSFSFRFDYNPPTQADPGEFHTIAHARNVNHEQRAEELTSDRIQIGNPVRTPNPVIPKSLYGKDAAAVLGATIATDGTFGGLWALSGDDDFESSALDAVHHWQYTASTQSGRFVEESVFIVFSLTNGEVKVSIEPDLPFPSQPKKSVDEQFSTGELYRVNSDLVKPPKALYSPPPEYSGAARVGERQGVVGLQLVLDKNGIPEDIWVAQKFEADIDQKTVRQFGLGLEQKALDAVRQWRFEPATKDGVPVRVLLNVEVHFRLY